jgi:hypothetical protein
MDMLSDARLVYELEREIRCNVSVNDNVVVSAYTLLLVFNRLAFAEGRQPGIDPDEQPSFDN